MKIGDLQQKMNEKLQEDSKKMEETVQENLQNLEASLKQSIKSVASTIENDINSLKNQTRTLTKENLKTYLFNFCLITLLSLGLILGIILASKGTSVYMIRKINNLQLQIDSLEQKKKQRQNTLKQIKTLGIILYTKTNKIGLSESFIILPQGMTAQTGWTVDKKEAIKLIK